MQKKPRYLCDPSKSIQSGIHYNMNIAFIYIFFNLSLPMQQRGEKLVKNNTKK